MIGIDEARKQAAKFAKRRWCRLNGSESRYKSEWCFDTQDPSGRPVARNLPFILVDMGTGAVRDVYLPSDEGFRILHRKTPLEED